MMVPMLAAAGFLAEKRIAPESAGTFPVTTPLFVVLLIGVILIVGALTFFPALSLGPDRRAPADAEREALLAWPSPSDRCSIRRSSGGRRRDAFVKLGAAHMVRNPVMFVVLVGSVFTTFALVRDAARGALGLGFTLQLALWLWFTVLFANFAEAMAEGRGKAQADALRKTRRQTQAKRLEGPAGHVARRDACPSSELRTGDLVLCRPGDLIPGDGEVVEGVASVDESAITGESAPVIRESGGDRSAVTGGTKVLSDQLVVRITANPGETFLDRMIALVEGASRQKTPNEIALTILLSGLTIIFLLAVATLQPFADLQRRRRSPVPVLIALLVCLIPTTIGGLLSAIGIAGMDRMIQQNVIAMSGRAVEAAGDVNTLAARQDRHDHARQPPGGRVRAAARASPPRSWPIGRSSRRCPTRRPRAAASSCWPRRSTGSAAGP